MRAQPLCAGLKVGDWGLAGEGGSEGELQRWEKGSCVPMSPITAKRTDTAHRH